MLRLIAIFALACGLAGCSSSPFSQAPVSQVTPTVTQSGVAGTKYDCVTEEGIGRTLPCGYANF